jgi:hypothetical protein
MSIPQEAVVAAAKAVVADRYATAAALAAAEAEHSASMVMQRGRVQNAAAEFVGRAKKAERDGEGYEQVLSSDPAYGHMAGIVATAKYTSAAANATRYAARAAYDAGAFRAAKRADHAADVADYRAEMARERAAQSIYAPFTAQQTARSARLAAAAARRAAHAAGPLGRVTTGTVGLATALLPAASRDRYGEEWRSDLCYVSPRQRARLVAGIVSAAIRLAFVLRQPKLRAGR